ncbi:hypothetical protein AVEN_73305-1, partial [Araneus ventricosus]
MIRYRELFAKE